MVEVRGLEGLVNGLPKPTMGLLGTRMLYETQRERQHEISVRAYVQSLVC